MGQGITITTVTIPTFIIHNVGHETNHIRLSTGGGGGGGGGRVATVEPGGVSGETN